MTLVTYPSDVSALIEALLDGVRSALGDNLVGFYLRGSLALGGFNPETSEQVCVPGPHFGLDTGPHFRIHQRRII